MDSDSETQLPVGFAPLCVTESKGHRFEIGIKQIPGRAYWRIVVLSEDSIAYANAYATDGVMRASVGITQPPGHLLFRCDVVAGRPDPSRGFQSKFGRATG